MGSKTHSAALAAILWGVGAFAPSLAHAQHAPAPAPSAQPAAEAPAEAPPAAPAAPVEGAKPQEPAPAPESRVKPAPPQQPVVRRVTTPIIVSGAIAGAGLVSGIVFAITAAGDHSSYKDKPDQDVALSGERSMFIADVSFGVAALFGLTALALYFLPDEPTPNAPAPARASSTRLAASALLDGLRF